MKLNFLSKVCFTILITFFLSLSTQLKAQNSRKFSVYFDVNQSKIKPNDYKTLDSVVNLIKKQPIIRRIQVSGYSDSTGNTEANQLLSDNRTDTVSNYILQRGLLSYKKLITTASLGESASNEKLTLEEQRRVDIILYFPKPDRDTIITLGCLKAYIKANSFEGFNNNELQFKLEKIESADDIKKNKITFKDIQDKDIISNGIFKLTATFKNKPQSCIQPIEIEMPIINNAKGYSIYTPIYDKSKTITWKKTDDKITDIVSTIALNEQECKVKRFRINNTNTILCAGIEKPACYCSTDAFGGNLSPETDNQYLKLGADKGGFLLNDGCFKKTDFNSVEFKIDDNITVESFTNFCNGFLYPGVFEIPTVPNYESVVLRYVNIDLPNKKEGIDELMVKKNKVLLMIPKSQIEMKEGKKYAAMAANTKNDNFLSWDKKVFYLDECKGLINCDYYIFEVPFTGFYTILELTPYKPSKTENKDPFCKTHNDNDGKPQKHLRIKVKKFNNAQIVWGSSDNSTTEQAGFVKNKGSHSILQPDILKSEKNNYKNHVFLCYVIKEGKRYAWIGKGSEMKKSIFSGNWKAPKLNYIPDEEWEEFIKKHCI